MVGELEVSDWGSGCGQIPLSRPQRSFLDLAPSETLWWSVVFLIYANCFFHTCKVYFSYLPIEFLITTANCHISKEGDGLASVGCRAHLWNWNILFLNNHVLASPPSLNNWLLSDDTLFGFPSQGQRFPLFPWLTDRRKCLIQQI